MHHSRAFRLRVLLTTLFVLAVVALACDDETPTLQTHPTRTPTRTPKPSPTATPTATSTPTPEPTADTEGCILGAVFQADVTVPDNMQIAGDEVFTKTWRLRNTGSCAWGSGYRLVFIEGDQMGGPASVRVPETPPGDSADVSVVLEAPSDDAQFTGVWQMCVNETECFGDRIRVQVVTFVPPTQTPTPGPTPTPTPAPPLLVEVINTTPHTDSFGDLVLLGEVQNLGSRPVKQLDAVATLYDAEGAVLASDSSYVVTPWAFNLWRTGVLLPGEIAPFHIIIDSPGQWEDWEIELKYEEAADSDFDDHYYDLEILNDQGRAVNELFYNYRVSGQIENIGSLETGNVRIVVTLYDAEGRIVGVEEEMTSDDELLPGETVSFSVDMYARGQVASYRLFIRSVKH
jgi:hypothetical protein